MPYLKRLDQKVALISLGSVVLVALLGGFAARDLLFLYQHTEHQLHDSRQGVLNSDFHVALVRAAGEAASFLLTQRSSYRDEANEALERANLALAGLEHTLSKASTQGLEGQHATLLRRQREVLAMVEIGFAAAEQIGPHADQASVDRVLDQVYAYEPLAGPLLRDVVAHREMEYKTNEHNVRNAARYTAYAFAATALLFIILNLVTWIYVRRLIVKPIRALADAAKNVAQGDFHHFVTKSHHDEIGALQAAFNRMVGALAQHESELTARNIDLGQSVAATRQAEERLQLALEGSNIATWDIDFETDTISMSPGWAIMIGEGDNAITTRLQNRLARVHPDELSRCNTLLEGCREGPQNTIDTDHRVQTKAGDWLWVQCRGRVIHRDAAGRAIRMAGTFTNISERKQVQSALQLSRDQLQRFSAKLNNTVEEERTHLARELHDELGQVFTGLNMDLAWLASEIEDAHVNGSVAALQSKIAEMSQVIDDAISVVRRIATGLRPPLLDNLGLIPALDAQAVQFEDRTGIRCVADLDSTLTLDRARAITVYRIFQEALTNVARHANATLVEMVLARQADGTVRIEVRDDGRGITAAQAANLHSVGLTGMRERARLIGATLQIQGQLNNGTCVIVEFPMMAETPT